MKHLIIGNGNIGFRYGNILKKLGENVDLVDIGFDPLKYNKNQIRKYDSVLICTPPETHSDIINRLPPVPIFCEKPLFVDAKNLPDWKIDDKLTLLSSNWIFCTHIMVKFNVLFLSYPSKCPYWEWDLIHFLNWHDYNYGEKNDIDLRIGRMGEKTIFLKTYRPAQTFCISNENKKFSKLCSKDGISRIIHKKTCEMHIEQLRHWIKVLQGKVLSVNPFSKAMLQHEQLNGLLHLQR